MVDISGNDKVALMATAFLHFRGKVAVSCAQVFSNEEEEGARQ